jgi:hypothetical protein
MKRDVKSYRDTIALLRSICPTSWISLFESFEQLSLKQRKAGILMCRARVIPEDSDSTLYRLTRPFITAFSSQIQGHAMRDILYDLFETPDRTALVLSLLLSASYDEISVSSIYRDMVTKEMEAMESEPKQSSITWSNLLSLSEPLHSDFRPAPNVNRYFRGMINRWISHLQHTIIFPHSSTKSLSKSTLRLYNEVSGNEFDDISPLQLEQYYCSTGVKIGGCCEMRQVWYPTNATPRTYYAMGGVAYHRSKYLRDIFNILGDYLPATNRHTRVDPSHLTVDKDEDTFVYDLTSFTSLYHEQRHFLDFIASIVEGVEIQILDTHFGICNVQLSDLIREYNTLNKQPAYSMERVGSDLILNHSVAGFLGVYANLITCTIPHGLSLMTMTDAKMKQWCAGDDAGTLKQKDDEWFKIDMMNNLSAQGRIQWEKCFWDNEGDPAVALKRRVIRLPYLLALLPNILFPCFSNLYEDDPRFTRFRGDSRSDRISRFCSGLSSMLYQMSLSTWTELDVSLYQVLLPHLYKVLGLPVEGWFPPLCGYGMSPYGTSLSFTVPRILGEFWREDPTKALLDAFMPKYFDGKVYSDLEWDGVVADTFECNSSKILSLACRLGFLEHEYVRVTYQISEDVRIAVYREYLNDSTNEKYALHRFTRLVEPPVWL